MVPPLALTYLIAGPPKLGKRVLQLFAALGGLIVSAGWWLAIVELWPADSRPWIGGSQNNSILELTLGYNGLGRLSGNETGSVGGGGMRGAGDAAAGAAAGGFPGMGEAAGGMAGGGMAPGGGAGGGMWGEYRHYPTVRIGPGRTDRLVDSCCADTSGGWNRAARQGTPR